MIFNKNKPYNATEDDFIRDCHVYSIPYQLVLEIYSKKRIWVLGFPFYRSHSDYYTYDEYQNMLKGASIAYNNQELMGKVIPNDNPRAIDINRYLRLNNVAIQYHPQYGMVLCDLNKNKNL